jgi:hypothetical protein
MAAPIDDEIRERRYGARFMRSSEGGEDAVC